jgi:ribose 5-phosphate isomerase B
MIIAVAADHAGFPLKAAVLAELARLGVQALDLGVDTPQSVDFPDYAERVGRALQQDQAERGILICGSGVGMAIAANKLTGVRACVAHDSYSAHQGVEHDSMNVLCLGSRVVGEAVACELVAAFVQAQFQQEERFLRRLEKIKRLEAELRPE